MPCRPRFPQLTRSALHRCFQRHGISRLPDLDGQRPAKKKFKVYPIGYFHIDLTEVRTAEGKLYLFVAIDRTSKFAFARLVERATRREAADFLQELIETVPYKIHTALTDNGTHSPRPAMPVPPPPTSSWPGSGASIFAPTPLKSRVPATTLITA